ncbi:MAG TPA: universal stress protein [Verrucomicrobiae bacterium]|nr:universal stress protein [Verrucomicrobiae bacterium]
MPTDFSYAATAGLKWASVLAHQCAAAVLLLHVIDINTRATLGPAHDLMHALWAEARNQMREAARRLEPQVETRVCLEEGLPWEIIVEKSKWCDLVVFGYRSKKPGHRMFSQRTTQRVLRNSNCPVILVPG